MSIYEYDEEKHMKQLREEGRQEGRQEGLEQMSRLVECLLRDNRSKDLLRATEDAAYRETLCQEYQL